MLALFAAALVLAPLAGCNEDAPQSDLDRFISSLEDLPADALVDTLRTLARGSDQDAIFARYQLGNVFYSQAADSARTRGWNDPFAAAALDTAQGWFEQAIAADSTFVEAYVNLGALWDDRADMMAGRQERQQREEMAEQMYLAALELRPHDEKARCNLGSLYKRQNDFEAAMNEYLTVLDHDPKSALARYNLAILFATQRIYREAIREFELAVKYDPEGDIGDRSRDNIEIIRDLMEAERAERAKPSS
jgi:tetratricopeptide (TPR) repeat protein